MNPISFPLVFIFSNPLTHMEDREAADSGNVQLHIPRIISSASVSKVEPRVAGQKAAKLNLKCTLRKLI